MILDCVRTLLNERATAIAQEYAQDDYGRIAALSVIVNAEDKLETHVKPTIDGETEQYPSQPNYILIRCVDLLIELIDDLLDPQWQEHLLNISLAGIAQEVEIYRGGEIDLPPLQKVIAEEASQLERLINRAITVQQLQFSRNLELKFPY